MFLLISIQRVCIRKLQKNHCNGVEAEPLNQLRILCNAQCVAKVASLAAFGAHYDANPDSASDVASDATHHANFVAHIVAHFVAKSVLRHLRVCCQPISRDQPPECPHSLLALRVNQRLDGVSLVVASMYCSPHPAPLHIAPAARLREFRLCDSAFEELLASRGKTHIRSLRRRNDAIKALLTVRCIRINQSHRHTDSAHSHEGNPLR